MLSCNAGRVFRVLIRGVDDPRRYSRIVLLCMSVGKLIAICHAVQWLKRHAVGTSIRSKRLRTRKVLRLPRIRFLCAFRPNRRKVLSIWCQGLSPKTVSENIRVSPLRWVRIGAWLLRGVCGLLFRYMNLTVIVASDVMLTTLFTIFISPATAFQIALMWGCPLAETNS